MKYEVKRKIKLSRNIFRMTVEAPFVAQARKPGQFVIVGVSGEFGERIPLTIADANAERGTIDLIFQQVGKTTSEMAQLKPGDALDHVAGPLGNPTHIDTFGTVVCVGGGIGAAPLLPIAKALRETGNTIHTILGARSKELLILEDDFSQISEKVIITTDDGSKGRKALVTEPLGELCGPEKKPDMVIAIGPPIMMKFCCEVTRKYNVPTIVSLNTIMIDGTGMCGGCRVEVGGETKFVCVDGPEFDGHKVDFDQMIRRLGAYRNQERQAYEQFRKHRCKIGLNEPDKSNN